MVSVSGLISGIDSKAIINALVNVQRQPIARMERSKQGLDIKMSKIGEIKSRLTTLKSKATDFKEIEGVIKYTATVSDSDVMTVTTDGTASPGSYALDVTQLATAEKDRSAAFGGGAFDEVKAGSLQIALDDGTSADITIEAGETLTAIKNKINAADLAVDASIIDDGTNAYLQISARNTGHKIGSTDSEAIVITETYTGLTGQELGITEISTATNATFTIDSTINVEKRSNSVSGVLEGVDMNLLKLGTTSLSVVADESGTKENIQSLVDAFNEVLDRVVPELRVTSSTNQLTSLSGDFLIRKLQSDLSGVVSNRIAGFSNAFTSLAEIGIETGADGRLKIDATKLDAALSSDIVAIGKLLAEDDIGIAAQIEKLADLYIDSTDGLLTMRTDSLSDRMDAIDDQVFKMEDRLASLALRLQRQFTNMEKAMSQTQAQGGALVSFLGTQNNN